MVVAQTWTEAAVTALTNPLLSMIYAAVAGWGAAWWQGRQTVAQTKQIARKDAMAEWQGLYDEKKAEVADLKGELKAVRAQNADQQNQLDHNKAEIDDLKTKHAACEEKHDLLQKELHAVKGVVTQIKTNGKESH